MFKFKPKQQDKNEPEPDIDTDIDTDAGMKELHSDNKEDCQGCPECPARADEAVDLASITAQLEEKSRLLDEMSDKYKRLSADFDNFRRRSAKEKEDVGTFVTERIVCELLPVVDNFERAVDMGNLAGDATSLSMGLEMIFRQFEAALTRLGVEPIEALGRQFDPVEHEAVAKVEATEDAPEGTIVFQVQKGYKLKGRVIRPSMVNVAGN